MRDARLPIRRLSPAAVRGVGAWPVHAAPSRPYTVPIAFNGIYPFGEGGGARGGRVFGSSWEGDALPEVRPRRSAGDCRSDVVEIRILNVPPGTLGAVNSLQMKGEHDV